MGDRLEFNAVTVSKFREAVSNLDAELYERAFKVADGIRHEVIAPFCNKWALKFQGEHGWIRFTSGDPRVDRALGVAVAGDHSTPEEMMSALRSPFRALLAPSPYDSEDFAFDLFHVLEILRLDMDFTKGSIMEYAIPWEYPHE